MAHQDLMDWVEKQLPWARDALRRNAPAQDFGLDGVGKSADRARVQLAVEPNMSPAHSIFRALLQ